MKSTIEDSQNKQRQAAGLQILDHLVQGTQAKDSRSKESNINFEKFISAIDKIIKEITEARDRSASDSGDDEKSIDGGLARSSSRLPRSPSSFSQKSAKNQSHTRSSTLVSLVRSATTKIFPKDKSKNIS